MNLFLLKAKRNKSPFFPSMGVLWTKAAVPKDSFGVHTHHTQKPKVLGLRFTKGKTMPVG
ncbi:hypothetical protein [Daejeonella sp.]|uniref:hypothetical protein n=1 Tax=Daejeonella sp. TaxID=2805397 RepID=UPI0025B87348|nr:hypothetical protein [Daejeonella sp.]